MAGLLTLFISWEIMVIIRFNIIPYVNHTSTAFVVVDTPQLGNDIWDWAKFVVNWHWKFVNTSSPVTKICWGIGQCWSKWSRRSSISNHCCSLRAHFVFWLLIRFNAWINAFVITSTCREHWGWNCSTEWFLCILGELIFWSLTFKVLIKNSHLFQFTTQNDIIVEIHSIFLHPCNHWVLICHSSKIFQETRMKSVRVDLNFWCWTSNFSGQ